MLRLGALDETAAGESAEIYYKLKFEDLHLKFPKRKSSWEAVVMSKWCGVACKVRYGNSSSCEDVGLRGPKAPISGVCLRYRSQKPWYGINSSCEDVSLRGPEAPVSG
eukprot:2010481-Pleurochrysis_carterae.AAC.1